MSVYFISNGPLIKIGKSKDPEARVKRRRKSRITFEVMRSRVANPSI